MNIDPSSHYHSGHRSVLDTRHPDVTTPVDYPEVSTHPDLSTHPDPIVEDHHTTDVVTNDVIPADRRSYRDVLIG